WDQNHYAIEDLGSLNGTYVNNEKVGKAALKDGDQILIGKHIVQFKDEAEKRVTPERPMEKMPPPKLDSTVVLDTKQAQELITSKPSAPPGVAEAPKERIGILNVLEGGTDHPQYVLTGKMTMIGKSDMASIKLSGFFAPKTAALVSKRDNKYFIAPSEAKIKIKINGEEVAGQRELKEGDLIEVAKVKATFSYQ
ncbi:MAG TPA: FHA domain-containing protein, partial [Alphaproteobacteria bacterium]|nr:FHA domain-containing protein [Alphaproteobacteria bacterium]